MKESESEDESERRFEEEIERLENEPSYMSASWEKFSDNPTDTGAKILWLKYTKLGEAIPANVMERMIKVIEYEVLGFSSSLCKSDILEPVLLLIHLAKEQPKQFWLLLHDPLNTGLLGIDYDDNLLERAREAFPHERKLQVKELYEFAGEQLKLDEEEFKSTIEDVVRKRYGTFKENMKNRRAEDELFK